MFKTWPKIKGEISFWLGRKSPKFEKYADFKPFKLHLIYCTARGHKNEVWCGAVMVLALAKL